MRTFLRAILPLALAAPAFASSGAEGEHHVSFITTIAPYVNFAVLVGVLVYLLRKPMKEFLTQKREAVEKMLKDSEAARDDAARKVQEMQAKLQGMEADIAEIRKSAEREAQTEKERVLADAREEARRILENAEKEIAGRFKVAVRDLKEYVANEAATKAEGIVKQKLKDDSHEALIDTYISNLSRN